MIRKWWAAWERTVWAVVRAPTCPKLALLIAITVLLAIVLLSHDLRLDKMEAAIEAIQQPARCPACNHKMDGSEVVEPSGD